MSKIVRQTAVLFGTSAGSNQIAQFGSLNAGAPTLYSGSTASPSGITNLSNWQGGWFNAVVGAASPAIEDLNAFSYVTSYQIAYQMQEGIPEWDSATTYYTGSIAQDGNGNVYASVTNSNTGNALSSSGNWAALVINNGSVSSNSANFSYSTPGNTYVSVTDGTNPITAPLTTHGKPVRVILQSDGSTGGAVLFSVTPDSTPNHQGYYNIQFLRDGNVIANTGGSLITQVANTAQYHAFSGWDFFDLGASSGSHTYTMQARVNTDGSGHINSVSISITGLKLVVYEG
jgi:hypothetical protein